MANQVSTEQLKQIIRATTVHPRVLPGYGNTSLGLFGRAILGLDCDEVYPNLFIGDRNTALNKVYLNRIGITHILNTAEGNFQGMVETTAAYYSDFGIQYMGIPLRDLPSCSISPYFLTTADFIDDGLKNNGKVLVHCVKGYSRSPAIVISYLALKVNMTVPMAMKLCCSSRKTCPNDGFLYQLAILSNCLRAL